MPLSYSPDSSHKIGVSSTDLISGKQVCLHVIAGKYRVSLYPIGTNALGIAFNPETYGPGNDNHSVSFTFPIEYEKELLEALLSRTNAGWSNTPAPADPVEAKG